MMAKCCAIDVLRMEISLVQNAASQCLPDVGTNAKSVTGRVC
jgi:hypothetical protein